MLKYEVEIMFVKTRKQNRQLGGFTLVEALVGTAIFAILVLSVYQAYLASMNVVRLSRVKVTATALANEQLEIIRNLPYKDIGIVAGLPLGKIPHIQNLTRDGKDFIVKTTIRNIDDPFDGSIGEMPNDLSPADYKLAEVELTCTNCHNFPPMAITTYIGPKNLESASTNGAIFVKVFDANGLPIQGVDVHIENNQTIPTFSIDDTTNNDGLLQIIDAPPGNQAYEISVSKNGYSSDRTYTIGSPENPSPINNHATVLLQQLTQTSFMIDRTSTLEVSSVTDTCVSIPNIEFSLQGEKTIGLDTNEQDIYKYNQSHATNDIGVKTITDLEWDSYTTTIASSTFDLAGVIPSSVFSLSPGTTQDLKFIVAPKRSKGLLMTILDGLTGLPLSDVSVRLAGNDFDTTLVTGRGYVKQTDWSKGTDTENFEDGKYFTSDNNVEIADPAGTIKLKKILTDYAPSAWLISSTFDMGETSIFHDISWQTQNQPPETGAESVRLQIATNNDGSTWNFIGPDGTSESFYTVSEQSINSVHNGDRYFRYKVYLQTADTSESPAISDILLTFTSDCVPAGQVFFNGLLNNSYDVSITKDGYQTHTETYSLPLPWQQKEVILNP